MKSFLIPGEVFQHSAWLHRHSSVEGIRATVLNLPTDVQVERNIKTPWCKMVEMT
jgi:hypothetical protein